MNTPAHLVISAALLGKESSRRSMMLILAGSVLPDLPMFVFYAWQTVVERAPEAVIWGERYFDPHWQSFFDIFNSVPLAMLGLGAGWLLANRDVRLFFSAMLLHFALDLPLHHDDGHRHFFPISSWRFESAVSYWDPSHLGHVGAGLELLALSVCAVVLIRRSTSRIIRVLLGMMIAMQVILYVALYVVGLLPRT